MVNSTLVILYGSQTGQSEALASLISEEVLKRHFFSECLVFCLDDINFKYSIEALKLCVIICSTTGDGDLPDNASQFARTIAHYTSLSQLKYCLLGLGDSNYSNFCEAANILQSLLEKKNAVPFLATEFADDAVGLELTIEPWIDKLMEAFSKTNYDCIQNIKFSSKIIEGSPPVSETPNYNRVNPADYPYLKLPQVPHSICNISFSYDVENIIGENYSYTGSNSPLFLAKFDSFEILSKSPNVKTRLLVTLDVSSCNSVDFLPGDSISLICPNDENIVTELISRLHAESIADLPFKMELFNNSKKSVPRHFPKCLTLRYAFTWCVDVATTPLKKTILRVLAEFTKDQEESKQLLLLSSREGGAHYDAFRNFQPSLVDVLNRFPSCSVPINKLLELLPMLQPRPYSICSSPLNVSKKVDILLSVVKVPSSEYVKSRFGLATGWINSKCDNNARGDPVRAFFRKPTFFRLPENPALPIIMIGPGSGVSPFIGFLQHRKLLFQEFSESHLFFGCRYKNEDFIFKNLLTSYLSSGALSFLHVAHSRDPESEDRYVTDSMRRHSTTIMDLLIKRGAILYICGDAKGMAKDVNKALIDMLASYRNVSEDLARDELIAMRHDKRIREEVWT